MRYLYQIIKHSTNDGGEDAVKYVKFDAQLQPDQRNKLQACLDHAKANAPENSSTADMIQDALHRFEAKTGVFGHICDSPVCDTIEF